jgi:membrane protein involved in colicin uptake
MTDEPHKPHQTEAEKRKEEAARRLKEALERKQNRPQSDSRFGGGKPGGNAPRYSPAPIRRGPRGG